MTRPVLKAKKQVTDPGGTTNVTISLTSGWNTTYGSATYTPVDGDTVIAGWSVAGTADKALSVVTAGYTQQAELYSDDTTDTNLLVATKRMTATPDTQVVLIATGAAADEGVYDIEVWGGVASTPMDVTATTATGQNTGQPNPAAIGPAAPDTVIVVIAASAHTTESAFTQSGSELSNFLSTATAGSNDANIGSGDFAWTSGSFDPVAWAGGQTSVNASWAAVTLALRPAVSSIAAGLATVTNTALGRGMGQTPVLASVSNSALALGMAQGLGLTSAANSAQALGMAQGIGLASAVNSALATGRAVAGGFANDNETALARGALQARSADLGAESDSAQALAAGAGPVIGIGGEGDAALALGAVQARAAANADEIAAAIALGMGSAPSRSSESDTGLAAAAVQVRGAGLASESDQATSLSAVHIRAAALASEGSSAFAFGMGQATGVANDNEAALGRGTAIQAGLATEADNARPLGSGLGASPANDNETAFSQSAVLQRAAGLSGEIDGALALEIGVELEPAPEARTVRPEHRAPAFAAGAGTRTAMAGGGGRTIAPANMQRRIVPPRRP